MRMALVMAGSDGGKASGKVMPLYKSSLATAAWPVSNNKASAKSDKERDVLLQFLHMLFSLLEYQRNVQWQALWPSDL